MRNWKLRSGLCLWGCLVTFMLTIQAEEPPIDPKKAQETARLKLKLNQLIEQLSEQISQKPAETTLYSRRGDAHFFNGDFKAAVADYNKMVELNPAISASGDGESPVTMQSSIQKPRNSLKIITHLTTLIARMASGGSFLNTRPKVPLRRNRGFLNMKKMTGNPFPICIGCFRARRRPKLS